MLLSALPFPKLLCEDAWSIWSVRQLKATHFLLMWVYWIVVITGFKFAGQKMLPFLLATWRCGKQIHFHRYFLLQREIHMKSKTNLHDSDVWNLHFFSRVIIADMLKLFVCIFCLINTLSSCFLSFFFLPSTHKSMMRCHVLLVISICCSVRLRFKLFCLFLSQEMMEQGCLETLSHTHDGCYRSALCIHLHMQGRKLSFTAGDVNSLQVCFSSNIFKWTQTCIFFHQI